MKYIFLDVPCFFLNNSLSTWFLQFTEHYNTKKWQHLFAISVNFAKILPTILPISQTFLNCCCHFCICYRSVSYKSQDHRELNRRRNKLGLRCAKLISSFGLAWHSSARPGQVQYIAWFGIHLKLNYQVSLLSLVGWVGEIKTGAIPSLG